MSVPDINHLWGWKNEHKSYLSSLSFYQIIVLVDRALVTTVLKTVCLNP